MSEATKAELQAKLDQTEADLAFYKGLMHIVRTKARADREVGDVLFNVIRRYQKQLKEESLR